MKNEKIPTIEELREFLKGQLNERLANKGIRAVACDIGLHENTLYNIIKGSKPQFKTAQLLREYYRRMHGES